MLKTLRVSWYDTFGTRLLLSNVKRFVKIVAHFQSELKSKLIHFTDHDNKVLIRNTLQFWGLSTVVCIRTNGQPFLSQFYRRLNDLTVLTITLTREKIPLLFSSFLFPFGSGMLCQILSCQNVEPATTVAGYLWTYINSWLQMQVMFESQEQ